MIIEGSIAVEWGVLDIDSAFRYPRDLFGQLPKTMSTGEH